MATCDDSTCCRAMKRHRTATPVARIVALALVLAGCGQGDNTTEIADRSAPTTPSRPTSTAAASRKPVTPAQSTAGNPVTADRFDQDDTGDASVLPASIARALETDQRVLDCAAGTRDGVSQFAKNWVGVRRIDLNDDGRSDWLLNGRHACLRPENTAAWWAYADDADGQRLVMAGEPATSLEVMATTVDGFHDLGLMQRDGHLATLRYADGRYSVREAAGAKLDNGNPDSIALGDHIDTVAGSLDVVAGADGPLADRYTLVLSGKTLMAAGQGRGAQFAEFPKPTLLRRFTQDLAPFDEVIVVQQNMWGNACDGGPLWMLGLKRDGSHAASKPIDFCGGAAPVITQADGGLRIVLPGNAVNRGEPRVTDEIWRYDGGIVSRQQSR